MTYEEMAFLREDRSDESIHSKNIKADLLLEQCKTDALVMLRRI